MTRSDINIPRLGLGILGTKNNPPKDELFCLAERGIADFALLRSGVLGIHSCARPHSAEPGAFLPRPQPNK